jgi:hypothetical protein
MPSRLTGILTADDNRVSVVADGNCLAELVTANCTNDVGSDLAKDFRACQQAARFEGLAVGCDSRE